MRILIISEYWVPNERGGGEISASLLVQGLVAAGAEVTVLTSYFLQSQVEEKKGTLRILRRLRTGTSGGTFSGNIERAFAFPKSIRKEVTQLLEKESFDVIHAMGMTSIPAVAQLETSIPRTAHVNSPVPFCPKGTRMRSRKETDAPCDLKQCNLKAFMSCLFHEKHDVGRMQMRPAIRYNPGVYAYIWRRYKQFSKSFGAFTHFFPISRYLGDELQNYAVPKSKITVLHNPVDLSQYDDLEVIEHKPIRVYYIGNYIFQKGLVQLIEALAQVKGEVECHLYGSGPIVPYLEKKARELNVSLTVHGRVKPVDLPQVHQSNDICVLPALVIEGLGRLLIEAMAAGNAVIGTDEGGIRDVCEHDKSGLLVPRDDVPALRDALQKLVSDDAYRKKIAAAGRVYAKKKFAITSQCEKLLNSFKKI